MSLWCCGTQEFLSAVQQFATAQLLEQPQQLGNDDVLFVELDDRGELDPLEIIAEAKRIGCTVVAACDPRWVSRLVDAVNAGAGAVALKPIRASDLQPYAEIDVPDSIVDVQRWRKEYAPEVIGESPALLAALEIAAQAAEFDCPVLITGESGTGKELLARAVHRSSPRQSNPFIPVNCPAIPKELVESELFGHSKGAFTGATVARIGRFAAADRGTLFLDEIGEMDLNIQSKMLRVLQDYQITPVGESRSQEVDVRIIAATNRDLEREAGDGEFREDLFYRLNVVQIHLPSLAQRRQDIPLLIEHFLNTLSEQRQVAMPNLTPAAREALCCYSWPGNVRQLRNVIERLVILHRGRIVDVRHLPHNITCATGLADTDTPAMLGIELPADGIDLRNELLRLEDQMIRKALMQTGGNKNQAAKILGLNRTTLVEKLRKRPAIAAVN